MAEAHQRAAKGCRQIPRGHSGGGGWGARSRRQDRSPVAACPKMAWRPAAESVPTVNSDARANFRNWKLIIEGHRMPRSMLARLGTSEGAVTSCTRCLALVKKLRFGNPQSKIPGLQATRQLEGPQDPMLPGEHQCLRHVGRGWGEGVSSERLPSPHLYPCAGAGATAQVHSSSTGALLHHIALMVLREQGPNLERADLWCSTTHTATGHRQREPLKLAASCDKHSR